MPKLKVRFGYDDGVFVLVYDFDIIADRFFGD
jgi:hypothetical protein